ncbi:MFS drug efflux pump [Coccidioides immitis RS]|uniref:MFS drug efflux pump n=1 Tax=Coccidioides immitis (strain RS) TaxID=246410 RepID=J3K6Y5_COCIM|nr:MFS drug efflux pump [Coccidioides immitis RS]EAS30387.3 MFS drug efflux pump [Coccidioides immitis RS]
MGSSTKSRSISPDEEKGASNVLPANARASGQETQEPSMTARRFMSFVAMAFLWTGSQIPVYLFGGCPPYIYGDIGGSDRWVWFVLANLLALAGVCPFVGSLSDLIGRRWVAIIGASLVCLGMIVGGTAKSMNIFIAGMAFAGAGAGVNELTALAATSEMAPTRQRGKYVAILIFTILPFAASGLWSQLIAYYAGWRYIGLFCGVWNGLGLVVTTMFYHPPPRVNSEGLSKNEIIRNIDFIGGILSIAGVIIFLAGLQWGGYQYQWASAHVLAPLIIGLALLVAFVFWEVYGAEHPILPRRLQQERRTFALTLVITFISGTNFFSLIMFWPSQAFNVYGHDPYQVGIRTIPVGFSILAGACIVLYLLSVLKGSNRELLVISSVFMTAGCGAMASANVDNMSTLWIILIIAGLGIGGIVVPASIITTIICPDDLIATVAAVTLSIRVVGGSIGYTIYYNVFISKFIPNAVKYIGGTMSLKLGIKDEALIEEAIKLTGESLINDLKHIPGISGNETAYQMVVSAGQVAFAESYKWVYYTSVAFGVLSIIAACFLGDIEKYMDDHVAVIVN